LVKEDSKINYKILLKLKGEKNKNSPAYTPSTYRVGINTLSLKPSYRTPTPRQDPGNSF